MTCTFDWTNGVRGCVTRALRMGRNVTGTPAAFPIRRLAVANMELTQGRITGRIRNL